MHYTILTEGKNRTRAASGRSLCLGLKWEKLKVKRDTNQRRENNFEEREAIKRPKIEPAAPQPGKRSEQHTVYWAGELGALFIFHPSETQWCLIYFRKIVLQHAQRR